MTTRCGSTSLALGICLLGLAASATAATAAARQAQQAMPASSAPPVESAFTPPVDLALWTTGLEERYRIPAIAKAPNGDLLAFFDARPRMEDLPNPISLVMRRSTDGGLTWQPQEVVRATDGVSGHGDPSVVVDTVTKRIFVFYASSVNAGFFNSGTGNDPNDPNIQQTDYSYSDDNGHTWQAVRITPQVKDPAWSGIFASSGNGIQLAQGAHAGRLIQQYVVRYQGQNWALSAYSDDHGATWQRGALTGPGLDENKTVELSDGSVMLNVRVPGARKVAISTDGGQTYDPVRTDPQQVDPGCNGSVTRVYPKAEAGSRRAQQILLLNDEDPSVRRNVTAKLSCDDGATWPGRVVIADGASAYVTATPLGNGKMAVLFERDGYSKISFTVLDVRAMGALCAPLAVQGTPQLTSGATTPVTVTLTNQKASKLPAGTLAVTGPDGWPTSSVAVPVLLAGQSIDVSVPVSAPDGVSGARSLRATYTTRKGASTLHLPVTVKRSAMAANHSALRLEPYIDTAHPSGAPGLIDDVAVPWVRVTNIGNTTVSSIRVTSSTGEPGCSVSFLTAGASTTCRDRATMGRVLTSGDIAAGAWAPVFTVTGNGPEGPVSTTAPMAPLDLVVP